MNEHILYGVGFAIVVACNVAFYVFAKDLARDLRALRFHLGAADPESLKQIADFGMDSDLPPFVRAHHARLLQEGRMAEHANSVAYFRKLHPRRQRVANVQKS